ncbi:MAG TPA: histone deacetylase [Thermohalobaculum sp.]|nr:histone deacetylase [Thermohalobaculum sp.]
MLPIVHHPDYLAPLKPGHRFPMSKYGYLRDALVSRGLMTAGGYLAPAPATAAQVSLAHDAGYVERVFSQSLSAWEQRRIGLPGTQQVARRARLASAGTLLAAWLALEHGIACNSAGGSHHAGPDAGAGYCVFNDVGVAVRNLIAQGFSGPVLVIDADVHQGDGTVRIFEGDAGVFTLSIHAARNFPARKAVSDMDVALPDGTGDTDYLEALRAAVARALAASAPRLVFYNAGVDVWEGDRLGRLGLSEEGIRARDAHVIAAVRGAGIPLVGVLGGGYDDDPLRLANRHAILFEEAARAAG